MGLGAMEAGRKRAGAHGSKSRSAHSLVSWRGASALSKSPRFFGVGPPVAREGDSGPPRISPGPGSFVVSMKHVSSFGGPLSQGRLGALGVTPRNGKNCTLSPGPEAEVAF